MADFPRQFIDLSRGYLTGEYLAKIHAALDGLSEDDVWWRPNESSNSIAHLLLHLSGNLRQWVVSGLGLAQDVRDRASEFSPDEPLGVAALLERLDSAVRDADAVLAALDPATLGERRQVQGKESPGLHVLYHAVEHFGMHTGQILYIAKLRSGRDLGFYRFVDGVPQTHW